MVKHKERSPGSTPGSEIITQRQGQGRFPEVPERWEKERRFVAIVGDWCGMH
ncbi:hypothetical protein V5799_033780, partial [Amblyomma americanum]